MQTLIENVNIVNPDDELKDSQNILIEDKIIKEISSDRMHTKENVNVIDGENSYVLPGFIDCHTHILAKGFHKEENMANPLAIHFYNAVLHAKQTINAGLTTIRDCGSADFGVKLAQQRGLFTAPKLEICVTPLVMTGGHFDLMLPSGFDMEIMYPGFPKGRCDGEFEVLKKTREVKRAGADFIKVMCSGGVLTTNTSPEFSQFSLNELKVIVNEAKTTNSKVSAHCHSLEGINKCIDAGFSSIEHGTFIDKNASRRMAENGVTLVPTLLVHQYLYENGFPPGDNYADEKMAKLKEIIKVHKENIQIAYDEGVNIVMGTDSGVIPHGHNLKELINLVDLGMTPKQAIATATSKAAEFMGRNDIGSVEVGKCADIIFLEKNPLVNIELLTNPDNILRVIQDGKEVKNKYGVM